MQQHNRDIAENEFASGLNAAVAPSPTLPTIHINPSRVLSITGFKTRGLSSIPALINTTIIVKLRKVSPLKTNCGECSLASSMYEAKRHLLAHPL